MPTPPKCSTTSPGTNTARSISRSPNRGWLTKNRRPTVQRVLAHALDTLAAAAAPADAVYHRGSLAAPEQGRTRARCRVGPACPASAGPPKCGWQYWWAGGRGGLVPPYLAHQSRRGRKPTCGGKTARPRPGSAVFQQALAAIREIRSRQNIATKQPLDFCIKCDAATAELLRPMTAYFQSMTNATATGFGPDVTIPPTHAKIGPRGYGNLRRSQRPHRRESRAGQK